MKKILITLTFIATGIISYSQTAPVPTSWDGSGTIPTGWSNTGTMYGASGHIARPSVKLSGSGQHMQIHLASDFGIFDYWVKGNVGSGTPSFLGTFHALISDNGTTWDTVRTLINGQVNKNGYTHYTDTAKLTSRYIRLVLTTKGSGNISMDEIAVNGIPVGPAAEINAKIDGNNVFDGDTYFTSETVGNTKRINVILENLGTDSTLTIGTVTSSSSEYVIVSQPTSVDSLKSDTLKIDFTPTASGARNGIVTIPNNDATENPYVINITGYGNGLATEPTNVPGISISDIKTYKYKVNITSNNTISDEGFLVLFKNGAIPTGTPVDGTAYRAGDMIGNAKVAYVGTDTSYLSKECIASSSFYVSAFAFSGRNTYINYTATSKIDSVTTPATMQTSTYYSGINTSSTNFITQLHTKINPHTLRYYSDFDDTYIDNFATRDTTNGQKVVTCVYTGDEYIFSGPFIFSYISREHTWPYSWMPTYGDKNVAQYNDYHNLYPTNQNQANAVRSNYPLGNVVTVTSSFKDGKLGLNSIGKTVYEPRDDQKGDAARAIFYMGICYTTVSAYSWGLPNPIFGKNYAQNQDVLKTWHWNDPVDEKEMARNDYIESVQGNRNPFTDSMQYVCYIDFTTMTRAVNAVPCYSTSVGMDENKNLISFSIFPNPANDFITLNYTLKNKESVTVEVYNTLGKKVIKNQLDSSKTIKGNKSISLKNISSGVYFVVLKGESFSKQIKFVKK